MNGIKFSNYNNEDNYSTDTSFTQVHYKISE